jgi:hypothetical protein
MLPAGNILRVFLEATRQHWLTTHVARKEGSDNFKMGRGPVLTGSKGQENIPIA